MACNTKIFQTDHFVLALGSCKANNEGMIKVAYTKGKKMFEATELICHPLGMLIFILIYFEKH